MAEPKEAAPAAKKWICQECGKEFGKQVGLMSHAKSHRPSYKCKHCGKEVRSLDAHITRMHSAEVLASDIENNLRADNARLRALVGRQEKEIGRLKGIIIRAGLVPVRRG